MVEKMKYISITGHISHMNHVVSRYLSRYDIQLEEAPHLPGQMEPFTTHNPYTKTLEKAEAFLELLGPAPTLHLPITRANAVNMVEAAHIAFEERGDKLRKMEDECQAIGAYIHRLEPFKSFDAPLSQLADLGFIHTRFGRMPIDNYRQYTAFLAEDEKILLHVCKKSKEYAWVVYFTPRVHRDTVDAVFSSLNFEAISLFGMLHEESYPSLLLTYWNDRRQALEIEIQALTQQSLADTVGSSQRLTIACEKVKAMHRAFAIKRHAALSRGKRIFTFVGWMPETESQALEAEIAHDDLAVFARYGETEDSPPIRLKNPPIIRQFEFFTRLYGLPVYGEVDPTPLLAVTYTLLFGLMFGDVGHGLVLGLIGLYIHLVMKKPLGGILAVVGVSAMIFGFLYGSIFGFEDLLPALWRRPMTDITGTLFFAVGVGVGLILLSMCLHMYNAAKQGRISDLLFGANGMAGLLFYSAVLWLAFRALIWGQGFTPTIVILALLPLVLVALKHPIKRLIEKEPSTETPGMFIFNTIIGLFETLLSYATNTISFVRVGAFAISHAGMMHVVLQLSQTAAGSRNLVVLLLGNIIVMVIEGLLIGIQVLRLDFYEIFSRFYTGGGRGFTPSRE
ncbi:MAG: hypothetical protein FWC73_06190 [Defluviitaleaceae bacterium]|nr:hypothetical protein [Defluviitaleaceae bacterium]